MLQWVWGCELSAKGREVTGKCRLKALTERNQWQGPLSGSVCLHTANQARLAGAEIAHGQCELSLIIHFDARAEETCPAEASATSKAWSGCDRVGVCDAGLQHPVCIARRGRCLSHGRLRLGRMARTYGTEITRTAVQLGAGRSCMQHDALTAAPLQFTQHLTPKT